MAQEKIEGKRDQIINCTVQINVASKKKTYFSYLFFRCLILCKLHTIVMGGVIVNSLKQRNEEGHHYLAQVLHD